MPKENIIEETDGNPETKNEDTRAHERRGFITDEEAGMDPTLKNPEDDFLD